MIDLRPTLSTAVALKRAIDALLAEAEQDFPEAIHQIPFPRDQGFQVAVDVQAGDIFQRAVLLEAFAAIHDRGLRDLSALIAREADYLMSRRRDYAPGGWSYFPDLHELPADADDLAQGIRALIAAGRRDAALEAAAEPLATLLEHGQAGPGLYETWIMPRAGDERHARQRWWIDQAWGRGPDGEVIANLVVALARLDPDAHAEVIAACRARIARMQGPDGEWRATWYHGPFYPGWVATLALGPDSEASSLWRARLRQSQRADGGWGWRDASDAQSTALAMMALDPRDPALPAARDYLLATQEPDGFWPGSLWIRMELGRATGQVRTVLSYGSRTIGAGYVVQALLGLDQER